MYLKTMICGFGESFLDQEVETHKALSQSPRDPAPLDQTPIGFTSSHNWNIALNTGFGC